ncbi:multifunctional methyltransferase subunit TRM112 [Cryptococcus deuterogattii 99/473]|uniref:Multifunctional methyltransferase subunit TRM112 n=2 Tax=Cryptococcus deuterogattii TaxID=1859096 RepID=A0A0D0T281_9TREE|nr:multifunctional methyltransferase subunit TRM112 [Cryptococcus deuterogattii LA55]KIR39822.1 multifunctional methyltransferase subunit TRM112 [Cryptococcus deuterogattii Ram5]KIR70628.1 multifunctional methyltransferase subunit TRM112 [Cryptococcus deuterogattii CA1014]KIR90792.1 multifunctional methyltransferase subunit TRM112 [Cryptococcus deuterogattii CBS 10090]KIY57890.1 multifunctional methyltransferase subunit TRM112 [Cryptococcus deuterogattii 99/473]
MVRLITHNMLACHVKNCTKDNFPLVFSEVELVERPAPINPDFIKRFLPKLDWKALVDTARSLGDTSLPDIMPENWTDEEIQALHHVLFELHVEEGIMTCRGCGHAYPVSNGIPNMLLAEHEVGR